MDPLYRLEMKRKSRGAGKDTEGMHAYRQGTIISAAAYRRGEHGHVMEDGRRRHHDYRHKRGIAYVELFYPVGVAAFARDSKTLWPEVERVERRKDALLAYELLATLPCHVPLPTSIKHLRPWIQAECVDKGMIADLAIHSYGSPLDPEHPEQAKRIAEVRAAGIPIYPLEEGDLLRRMPTHHHHHAWELPDGKILLFQPHAHILITSRAIGPDGFGLKVKAWGQKAQLYRWRQSWAETYNAILAEAGRPERVSAEGRWKQKSASEMSNGRPEESEPISRAMTQSIDIGGGHHAGLEGRPPKQRDGTFDMTKFDFNQRVRALHKGEAALQAEREAAERDREELVEAIARVQQLAELGVDLDLDDPAGILIEDPGGHVTAADARLLNRHRKVLVKVLAAAPAKAPPVDDALRGAMVLIVDLQRQGVTFHRTAKGSLGFEPEGAVPPEIYKKFAGMHDTILWELERRRYAGLWKQGQERLQAQKQQIEAAEEEQQELRRSLDSELERRRRLEDGAKELFESARAGKSLPEADAGSSLLQEARRLILGYRHRVKIEKQRADTAERALEAFKKTADALWEGVSELARRLGWMAGWTVRRRPEFKDEMNSQYREAIAALPDAVRSRLKLRNVPGLLPLDQALPSADPNARQQESGRTGSAPVVDKTAWTLPEKQTEERKSPEESSVPLHPGKHASHGVRRDKQPPER